jgi:hypothetical protein
MSYSKQKRKFFVDCEEFRMEKDGWEGVLWGGFEMEDIIVG